MPLNITDERLSRWAEDPLVSVDIANAAKLKFQIQNAASLCTQEIKTLS